MKVGKRLLSNLPIDIEPSSWENMDKKKRRGVPPDVNRGSRTQGGELMVRSRGCAGRFWKRRKVSTTQR